MQTLAIALFVVGRFLAQAAAPAAAPLAADTPKTTVPGNTFIAPAGWTVSVRGPATILAPPEGDSWIALVDVDAKDADAAIAAAWAAYKPDAKWPLKVSNDAPGQGRLVEAAQSYEYQTSPNEKRGVQALARVRQRPLDRRASTTWATRSAKSAARRSP